MKHTRRLICLALALVLLLGTLPAQALAAPEADETGVAREKPDAFVTGTGETVPVDASFEEEFPYGAFLIDATEIGMEEGGEDVVFEITRLGGSAGRATVYVLFNPLNMPVDNAGTMGSGSAAGFDDLVIEYEDPLPVAAYQPVGREPDPEPGDAGYVYLPYSGTDALEGDRIVRLDTAADSYQWYSFLMGGWQRLLDADTDQIVVGAEEMERYDFRCVYSVGGVKYCSTSVHGEAFVPSEPEELAPIPEGLELWPERTFTRLEPESGDGLEPCMFPMTFADGEWSKQIRLHAVDDDIAESVEFAYFTLVGNEGGDIYEKAGTVVLSLLDNEAPEPFTLGFEVTEFTADKGAGTAYLDVVRTGGGQTPVSIAYHTVDGSALAGVDYTAAEGELLFFGDIMRQTIEVPLIDGGDTGGEPVRFRVVLDGLKGDGDGLCTLTETEAGVTLTHATQSETRNLATMLAVTNRSSGGAAGQPEQNRTLLEMLQAPSGGGAYAVDRDTAALRNASGLQNSAYDIAQDVSGLATIASVPPLLQASNNKLEYAQTEIGEEDLAVGRYELGHFDRDPLNTYNYGSISFTGGHGGSYWGDYAYVAGVSNPDITGWKGGHAEDDGWIIESKSPDSAWLIIKNMGQLYSGFHGWAKLRPHFASDWTQFWCGTEYVYPKFTLYGKNGTLCSFESKYRKEDGKYKYTATKSFTVTDIPAGDGGIILSLHQYDAHDAEYAAWIKLTSGEFTRRTMGKNLRLTVHTANDGDDTGDNVRTAPNGAAALDPGSGVYKSMKPVVTLVPGAGGTDPNGKLYVGSQVQVQLTNTASYFPYSGDELSAAVYLTRGGVVQKQIPVERSGNIYTFTMLWSGMTRGDIENGEYTINVVMTRKQDFTLDLSPSVQRATDDEGNPTAEIDNDKVPDAFDLFWNSGSDHITVGYSPATANQPHFSTEMKTIQIKRSSIGGKENDPVKALGSMENVQYINFNRSENDIIVYHGKEFKGNQDIWLDVDDLARPTADFLYYNEKFVDAVSIMKTKVDSVGIYWDGNCNGRIDGYMDETTGYFVLDENSHDSLYFFMDKGESVSELMLQPTKDENGKTHEFIAKVFYTMTPRCLVTTPEHENDSAQVLPALTTSITDAGNYGNLTEPEKSYRYVESALGGDGKHTSDGHLMYGAAANKVSYVDVRLGGDYAPAHPDENNQNMVWTPDYHGYLLTAYEKPDPVILEQSMLGENYPLTGFEMDENYEVVLTDAQRKVLNNYLGAFVGDTTIALCTQAQVYTTDGLKTHADALKPESSTLIGRSVYPDPGDIASRGTDDRDLAEGDGPEMSDEDNPYPGFSGGFNYKNGGANLRIPAASPILTMVFNEDTIQIAFSITLCSFVKGQGWMGPNMAAMKSGLKQINELDTAIQNGNNQEIRNALNTGDRNNAGQAAMKSFSFNLSFTAIVTLKRDKVENVFIFDRLAIGIVGSIFFRIQGRLPACPIVYFFFRINASMGVTGTLKSYTTKTYRLHSVAEPDAPIHLAKGEVFEFTSPYLYIDIDFVGKVYIETLETRGGTLLKDANKGYLTSNGKLNTVKLAGGTGTKFADDKTHYVRVVALEDTTISRLDQITAYNHELHFGGLTLDPKATFDIGVGVGIELLKAEIFVRFTAAFSFSFGAYDPVNQSNANVVVDSMKFGLGLFISIYAIAFSFDLPAVEVSYSYTPGAGWSWTLSSIFMPVNAAEGGGGIGLPESDAAVHNLRAPARLTSGLTANGAPDDLQQPNNDQALKAYQTDAPFQVSGYSGSVSAFTLADRLASGYDYRVVTAGGRNYLLYTISRPAAEAATALDHSMLVLSEIIDTGTEPGLVNPIDRDNATPYIVVDTDAGGDLECAAWADGNEIRVAWVSYADHGADSANLRSLSAAQLFRSAAEGRVVKTAVFDTSDDASKAKGFSTPVIVSEETEGDMVFLPIAASGGAVAYIEADPVDEAELSERLENYTALMKRFGYAEDAQRFRVQVQSALWRTAGDLNRLSFSLADGRSIQSELAQGQIVENLEMTKLGDDYCLAFTTAEQVFTDTAGNETDAPDEIANMLTVRRLCLKLIHTGGAALSTEKTAVIRTLYDYERNSGGLTDGSYVNGGTTEAEDPGFANLRFLRANLGKQLGGTGGSGVEDFLVFDMCGETYVIREGDLKNLASRQSGVIVPFFTAESDTETAPGSSGSGRTEAVIGADGDGGLAAVYVSSVPYTSNNALYISAYDSVTGTWGAGSMLAMNHMDVYEASIREGWDEATATEAYVDKDKGGGMDVFKFSNLQIALGAKRAAEGTETPDSEGGKDSENTLGSDRSTLLVLTQGSYQPLQKVETEHYTHYIPTDAANRSGIYGVSYGRGQQAIGKGSVSFLNDDFSVGAELRVTAGFTNTGDVGIRGSKNQPVTVALIAEGENLASTRLAEWKIYENILPGRAISLSGHFKLPVTLPEGTELNLYVSEDKSYTENPYSATLHSLVTIRNMPELGYEEDVSFTPRNTSASGQAVYDVDFTVGNRGNADATNVTVRFTCETGKLDADGQPIYAPLDISDSNLTVGKETPLLQAANGSSLGQGILALGGIRKGYGRQVTGTITVPRSAFKLLNGNTADIRLEICSDADHTEGDRIVHGEYNSVNNVQEVRVNHSAFFGLPEKITIPLGTTLRLPVHYHVTDPSETHILVSELPQTEDRDGVAANGGGRFRVMAQRISELWYEESSFSNGTGYGTVVISPMEEGCSYIRIQDLSTNSYADIPCEVTPQAEGLNIFTNSIFGFRNADGSAYDPGNPAAQNWTFPSGITGKWYADGSAPMMNDLAKGAVGAVMTYESECESLSLSLHGKVRVDSTLPGFKAVTLSSVESPAELSVSFGDNGAQRPHTITVTVLETAKGEQYAELDRLSEHYHQRVSYDLSKPVDTHAPRLIWSSSFPEPGSLHTGSYELTLSAVDDGGLSDFWVESDVATVGTLVKETERLWTVPLTVTGNGTIVIHTRDTSANHGLTEVNVNWWGAANLNNGASFHIETAELKDASLRLMAGPNDPVPVRHIVVTPGEMASDDLKLSVSLLRGDTGSGLTELKIAPNANTPNAFRAETDGLYLVRAETVVKTGDDEDYAYRIIRNNGTIEEGNAASKVLWTAQLVRLETSEEPEPLPYYDPTGGAAEPKQKTFTGEDGTTATVTYDAAGAIERIDAAPSEAAVSEALASGAVMPLPVTVPAGKGSVSSLPVLSVEMPDVSGEVPTGKRPRLAIPVTGADADTVAFRRDSDGSWKPVKDCYLDDGKLIVPVDGPCELRIGSNAKTFPDVRADAWYAPYVRFVTARGIFNGTGSGFEPEGVMTRAMIAQVLYNLDPRSGPVQGAAPFRDVDGTDWYYDAVAWAAAQKIIQGYDGAFDPDAPVSRQDLVTILYRYAKAAGYPLAPGADLSAFKDAGDVADYAKEAMGWAVAIGAVNGMGDGTLSPGGTATRAQVAKIIQVFLETVH